MKLLKDSAVYLFGELAAKALPFLMLPYLTRHLGAEAFGELSYYQTFAALFLLVFSLSQEGAAARYYYFYGQRNLPLLVRTGYAYTALLAAAGLAISAWFGSAVFAVLTATAAVQSMLGVQLGLRQCRKQALSYVAVQTGCGVLTCVLTVVLLETTASEPVLWRLTAVLLGNAAVFAAAVVAGRRSMPPPRWSGRRMRLSLAYIFSFGLPLVLHNISGLLKGQLDRFLIFHQYSAADLGIYAAAFQAASVWAVLLAALNKAAVPHYFEALKQGRLNLRQVHRYSAWALAFAPVPALAAALLPESLFVWLLGSQYRGSGWFVSLFLFGFGLTAPYYLLVNFLFYHARNRVIALCSLLSTAAYVLVLLAATRFGLHCVPLAMIAGNALILPVLYVQTKKAAP